MGPADRGCRPGPAPQLSLSWGAGRGGQTLVRTGARLADESPLSDETLPGCRTVRVRSPLRAPQVVAPCVPGVPVPKV